MDYITILYDEKPSAPFIDCHECGGEIDQEALELGLYIKFVLDVPEMIGMQAGVGLCPACFKKLIREISLEIVPHDIRICDQCGVEDVKGFKLTLPRKPREGMLPRVFRTHCFCPDCIHYFLKRVHEKVPRDLRKVAEMCFS